MHVEPWGEACGSCRSIFRLVNFISRETKKTASLWDGRFQLERNSDTVVGYSTWSWWGNRKWSLSAQCPILSSSLQLYYNASVLRFCQPSHLCGLSLPTYSQNSFSSKMVEILSHKQTGLSSPCSNHGYCFSCVSGEHTQGTPCQQVLLQEMGLIIQGLSSLLPLHAGQL